ncbi:MAG: hypothetical protein HY898_15020 [Deltaproteobacteria bacterium]|nr:hypothetical protein [Deltaproteobacteria bacterium]
MTTGTGGLAGSWRAAIGAGLIAAALCASSGALAQDEARKVGAETLFADGRRLMAEGNYALACPKLKASQKLDPAIGTLLNLGACYEKAGKPASAWASFREAAGAAAAAGDTRRQQEALSRAAALRPRCSTLTITTESSTAAEGLSVTIDRVDMDKAMLGTAVPLDPGSHTIEANAPGKLPWKSTVLVPSDASSLSAVIPALQDAPPGAPATAAPATTAPAPIVAEQPAAASDKRVGSTQRTAGLIVGGVGAVTLITGGILALSARSKWEDAKVNCPDNQCETEADVQNAHDARSRANVATVVMSVGAASLVGGAVLWLLAPSSTQRGASADLRVAPIVGQGSAGISLRGGF